MMIVVILDNSCTIILNHCQPIKLISYWDQGEIVQYRLDDYIYIYLCTTLT